MSTGSNIGTGAAIGSSIAPGVGTVIGAGVGAVGSLLGANKNAKSADHAVDAQTAAANAALAEKKRLFDIEQAQRAPYLAASQAALGRLGAQAGSSGPMALPAPYQAPQNPYARFSQAPQQAQPMMGMAPQQGTAPQTAGAQMNTPAGMVTVQDPASGRQAHIPQAQLQTALSRGLKQVG